MKTFEVDIEPALLTWAREKQHLSIAEAAERLNVFAADLELWELGELAPTWAQLRKIASVYKRPVALFYLSEPPRDFVPMRDFRKLPSATDAQLSVELDSELERIHQQRNLLIELVADTDDEPEPLSLSLSQEDDEESAGTRLREWLNITTADQQRWSDEYDALRGWTQAVESRDILVMHIASVEVSEIRGCSVTAQPFPVVALNNRDTPLGRIFTLLHEVVHVLLQDGGICNLRDGSSGQSHGFSRIEGYCNSVAAACLLPMSTLLEDPDVLIVQSEKGWSDRQLTTLSRRYWVSREAILRRLVTLRRATMKDYLARRRLFLAEYEQAEELDSPHFQHAYNRAARRVGSRFARELVTAYQRREITGVELYDNLGVPLHNLDAFIQKSGIMR